MDYNLFKQAVMKNAAEQGITEYDLYYSQGTETWVSVFEKQLDDFSDVQNIGICFRCIIDGKTGYASTQNLCEEEALRIVKNAKECAGIIDTKEAAYIFEGSESYPKPLQEKGEGCDVNRLKEIAFEIEKKAFALDSRIDAVASAGVQYGSGSIGIYNSKGLDLVKHMNAYAAVVELTAKDGDTRYSGFSVQEVSSLDALDLDALTAEAVGLAVGGIGGAAPASGKYPVIFSARVASMLLGHFSGIFSEDAALKGISLLKGKTGEKVASDAVNFFDDPHCGISSNKTHFDDEGVATYKKYIIEKGVLKTLLSDLATAAKSSGKSTGNGRKSGYSGSVHVAPFLVGLEPGELTLPQLIEKAGKGLYVTEIKGLHASADVASGDFSLESKGQFFDGGKIVKAAEQFTIAGNFYTMLKGITAVGSEAVLSFGAYMPPVLVDELSIAGE